MVADATAPTLIFYIFFLYFPFGSLASSLLFICFKILDVTRALFFSLSDSPEDFEGQCEARCNPLVSPVFLLLLPFSRLILIDVSVDRFIAA